MIVKARPDLCCCIWHTCCHSADTGESSAITTSQRTRCHRITSCPSAGLTTSNHTATTTTLTWRCPTTGWLAPIRLTDVQFSTEQIKPWWGNWTDKTNSWIRPFLPFSFIILKRQLFKRQCSNGALANVELLITCVKLYCIFILNHVLLPRFDTVQFCNPTIKKGIYSLICSIKCVYIHQLFNKIQTFLSQWGPVLQQKQCISFSNGQNLI